MISGSTLYRFGLASLALWTAALIRCSADTQKDGANTDSLDGTEPVNGGSMYIWVEHMATKVQPTTAPGAGPEAEISLEGARRSYVSAQIVITAIDGPLSGVDMKTGGLEDSNGNIIEASNVRFFREFFIDYSGVDESEPGSFPVPESSPTADPLIPDPLIPFVDPYSNTAAGAPFRVPAGQNQPVWVDIFIPETAAPGVYAGVITVSSDGLQDVEVPVSVTVWDVVLPDKNVVTTYFQAHFGEVINYHRNTYEGSDTNPWLKYDDYTRTLVKRYQELIHSHRLDTWMEFIPPPNTNDNCTPPETAEDWSEYDDAVAPYMDGTYFEDGVPNTWLVTPFSPGVTWGLEADCTDQEYTALAASWADHLMEMGWFERAIVYAYDEPDESVYPEIAFDSALMQEGDTEWKAHIMDTVEPNEDSVDILNPALGIYTVCLRCYDQWSKQEGYEHPITYGRDDWSDLFDRGIKLWFYESNAQSDPYPTFAANTLTGVEPMMVMWGSWFEKASGFLYWDVIAWDNDEETGGPWGPNVDFGKSGDGVLIYPGNHDGFLAPMGSPSGIAIDGPIPSVRLKLVRAGLQDWALFKAAEDRGEGDLAREQVGRVYGQFGGCDWDGCPPPVNGEFYWKNNPALMDDIRRNVALGLTELR